jgi:hypothetical protein
MRSATAAADDTILVETQFLYPGDIQSSGDNPDVAFESGSVVIAPVGGIAVSSFLVPRREAVRGGASWRPPPATW